MEYPENGDWVIATGVFDFIEIEGTRLMGIHLDSVEILDEPGNMFVFQ